MSHSNVIRMFPLASMPKQYLINNIATHMHCSLPQILANENTSMSF